MQLYSLRRIFHPDNMSVGGRSQLH